MEATWCAKSTVKNMGRSHCSGMCACAKNSENFRLECETQNTRPLVERMAPHEPMKPAHTVEQIIESRASSRRIIESLVVGASNRHLWYMIDPDEPSHKWCAERACRGGGGTHSMRTMNYEVKRCAAAPVQTVHKMYRMGGRMSPGCDEVDCTRGATRARVR